MKIKVISLFLVIDWLNFIMHFDSLEFEFSEQLILCLLQFLSLSDVLLLQVDDLGFCGLQLGKQLQQQQHSETTGLWLLQHIAMIM